MIIAEVAVAMVAVVALIINFCSGSNNTFSRK